jgi:hypothetical protein
MRYLIIIIWTLMLVSCSRQKEVKSTNDFATYLGSLDSLETPVKFDTKTELKSKSERYDTALFKKYKHAWASVPYGKIFENDSIVVLVDVGVGDILVPLITTFTQQGDKLDSINPYDKAGADMGYLSYEFVTINSNKEIIVTDSTKTWKLNKDETDVIQGTERLTLDTVIYRINNQGKIIKQK